jgi:uncharacterized damage-inducible protein DinB
MLLFFDKFCEILEYSYKEIAKTIAGLPQEALDWIPGENMNSLCVLIVHTAGAERYWVGDVAMGESSNRDRAAEFQAKGLNEAALKKRLDDTLAYTRQALERLTLADLEKMCIAPRDGSETTVGWALMHALEHTSLHLGHAQITRQLWDQKQSS